MVCSESRYTSHDFACLQADFIFSLGRWVPMQPTTIDPTLALCLSVSSITQKVMSGLQKKLWRGHGYKGTSDYIFVVIWITMLTVQSEIRPNTQQLSADFK